MSKRIIDLPTGSLSPSSLTFIGDPTSGSLSQVTYAAIKAFFQSTASGQISGSGIDGFLPLWRGTSFLTSSILQQINGNVTASANSTFTFGNGVILDKRSNVPRLFSNQLIVQANGNSGDGLIVLNDSGPSFNNGTLLVVSGSTSGVATGLINIARFNGFLTQANGSSQGINFVTVDPIISQSSGYIGTVRAFYYNPAVNAPLRGTHIAFENTIGNNIFNTSSGSTFIGYTELLATSSVVTGSFRLLVSGSTFVAGNVSSSNYVVGTQGIVVAPAGFAGDGLTPLAGNPLITQQGVNSTYSAGGGQGFAHDFRTNGQSRLFISDNQSVFGNQTIYSPASASTGNIMLANASGSFIPITGSNTNFTSLAITTNINQSLTGSGFVRGLYINPFLVSAIDYRAIEVATGRSIFSGSIAVSGSVTASNFITPKALIDDSFGVATNNLRRLNGGTIQMWADTQGPDGFSFTYQSNTSAFYTTASNNYINIFPVSQLSTGSANYTTLAVQPNISQSTNANGITRGIFINPSLTGSITDFRALDISQGKVLFNGSNIGQNLNSSSNGLFLINSTAATISVNQNSPVIWWEGRGWNSSSGSSQPVIFAAYTRPPTQGVTGGEWVLEASVSGSPFGVPQSGVGGRFLVDAQGTILAKAGAAQDGGSAGAVAIGVIDRTRGMYSQGAGLLQFSAGTVNSLTLVGASTSGSIGGAVVIADTNLKAINNLNVKGTTFLAGNNNIDLASGSLHVRGATNNSSSRALYIDNSGSVPILTVDNSGLTSVFHIGGGLTGTPTIITGSAAGTGATVNITGSDAAGIINLTSGISVLNTGSLAIINFATAYSKVPYVVFSPTNTNTATATGIYVTATTSSFTINDSSTLSISTPYSWNYVVIQ